MSVRHCTGCRKVTIPSEERFCSDCAPIVFISSPEEGRQIMDENAEIFRKLAKYEALGAVETVPKEWIAEPRNMSLPTDSATRKNYPLLDGCLRYFPAALAGVAHTSKLGNDKHNPGEPLHHARGKSMDHGNCILRHLTDLQDLLAAKERSCLVGSDEILAEASSLAWRALALSQELHEKFGSPLAPGAKE